MEGHLLRWKVWQFCSFDLPFAVSQFKGRISTIITIVPKSIPKICIRDEITTNCVRQMAGPNFTHTPNGQNTNMDKFVVKKPRENPGKPKARERPKQLTQATIESLKGVVVVEDVLRQKTILKVENQTKEKLIDALTELSKKTPSRNVLKSTKIGHTVNRLTKHPDTEVSRFATKIVKEWKEFFEAKLDRPMLEVRCDNKTEELRKTGRKHLAQSLETSEKADLPKLIEQEVFYQHGRLVSAPYRRSLRKLVFTLKHQESVRAEVTNGTLEVKDLVKKYKQDSKVS